MRSLTASKFDQSADACTRRIYRKDRTTDRGHEYMDECKRNTGPWQSQPAAMLRLKR